MNKASKKAIRKYCSEIRKWMTCSTNIKHAFFLSSKAEFMIIHMSILMKSLQSACLKVNSERRNILPPHFLQKQI